MIERCHFAHTGAASALHPGGSTLVARVRASGYPWGARRADRERGLA